NDFCIGFNFICFNLFHPILAKEIHGDSCGRIGIGETPQCVSARRLTSRPRKAECISVAGMVLPKKNTSRTVSIKLATSNTKITQKEKRLLLESFFMK